MFFRSYVCAYGIFIGRKLREDTSNFNLKNINPIKYIKEKCEEIKVSKDAEAEKEYWSDVFENLENFDGFKESQKEVRNIEK